MFWLSDLSQFLIFCVSRLFYHISSSLHFNAFYFAHQDSVMVCSFFRYDQNDTIWRLHGHVEQMFIYLIVITMDPKLMVGVRVLQKC
jgi:hypothetical protein